MKPKKGDRFVVINVLTYTPNFWIGRELKYETSNMFDKNLYHLHDIETKQKVYFPKEYLKKANNSNIKKRLGIK